MRNIQWELKQGFRHFGGGPSIPAGMSGAERESLLAKEAELASIRDQEQRDFLSLQEEQRLAREDNQRVMAQQEEESRLAELERLELEGADVAEEMEEPIDTDTGVADMFASLAFGTEFVGDSEEEAVTDEQVRPE
jgi:hypothetical protein